MTTPEQQISHWLERVVIGLNLCPFAATPHRRRQVRIITSPATTQEALVTDLLAELDRLDQQPAEQLETTLLVIPHLLGDFDDYCRFLEFADQLLHTFNREGVYQIASFHPDYRFEGTAADEPGNLTNRAPFPILHLLREASLERILARYPDPDAIPQANIRRMESLTREQQLALFPHLFGGHY